MMKSNINYEPLRVESLPDAFLGLIPNPLYDADNPEEFPEFIEQNILSYPSRTDLHHSHGWRDVIMPEYNSATHKLGELIFDEDNDVVTYEVIEKTQQEIEAEVMAQAQLAQEEALMAIKNSKILSEIQEFGDEDALQNQSAYPLWESGVYVGVDKKRQDLNSNNELKLFKCVQAHTTQSDWRPKDTPALWVEVAPPGVIPVWIQPQGAHDAYQIDDLVHFPTESDPVHRNTVANNVYAPDVYGWVLND